MPLYAEVPSSASRLSQAILNIHPDLETATKIAEIPKVILGNSIFIRLVVEGDWTSLCLIMGTNKHFRSSPGVVATLRRSTVGADSMSSPHSMVHCKGHSGRLSPPSSPIHSRVEVARGQRNLEEADELWLIWREGLFSVGEGATFGQKTVMMGDIAQTGPDVFENAAFVTDDVTSVFVASDAFIRVYATLQSRWVNNPECKLTRAFVRVGALLPPTSAASQAEADKTFGRQSHILAVAVDAEMDCVNALEIAWWLRFCFSPQKKSIFQETDEHSSPGRDIRISCVRRLADKMIFLVTASVTDDVLPFLLSQLHTIPKTDHINLRVYLCGPDSTLSTEHH